MTFFSVSLFDTSEDGDTVKGAINYWANMEDKECQWHSPSLMGGDVVCLLGVTVSKIDTARGPFGKVVYQGIQSSFSEDANLETL